MARLAKAVERQVLKLLLSQPLVVRLTHAGQEVKGFGYRPHVVESSVWQIIDDIATCGRLSWRFDGPLGSVSGYSVEQKDGTVLWSEPFKSSKPVDIQNQGDILSFEPAVRIEGAV